MRKILIYAIIALSAFGASAQSIDERIGYAMNSSDWFALDSIYNSASKDSIHEFLEVYSRCLLGNRLNRPEISIPAFQELFNKHSAYLDPGNLVASVYMFGMDLSRVGENEAAASMTNSIVEASKQYLDSNAISGLTLTAKRYSALAAYKPYRLDFGKLQTATIPFTIEPVGPTDKGAVLMRLRDSYINGTQTDITFDTGAGTNIISPEMAEQLKLTPLEGTIITVKGIRRRDGYVAIAKELRIGDIMIENVPFTVMSLSSGNDEADKYIDCFNIVVGSELMLQLKDVTIDFTNHRIIVPAKSPEKSDATPNLCFSSTMNLLTKGTVQSSPMLMCLDCGDASFGSLGNSFYEANKDYVTTHARPDTIREAGIGGVVHSPCYHIEAMPISLGGNTVFPAEMTIKTIDSAMLGDYDCIIGVRTLMLYDKVRFNLVDFVLSTELPVKATSMVRPE